jgi:hypothetical protein
VMAARLVSPALRLLPGQVACMAASCCFRVTWRFAPPHASVASHESCVRVHALVGACTCRAGRRLVVRGGDLSCGGSSSGKLVGDAAIRPRTSHLASEGLDEDLHAFPETQHQVKGGLLLDVVVSMGTTILELLASKRLTPPRGLWFRCYLRRIILPSKGALIRALVTCGFMVLVTGGLGCCGSICAHQT